jgi:hypothetical protein
MFKFEERLDGGITKYGTGKANMVRKEANDGLVR